MRYIYANISYILFHIPQLEVKFSIMQEINFLAFSDLTIFYIKMNAKT